MKPRIKLGFLDFWEGFDPHDNYFIDVLKPKYDLEITNDRPDFVIYSCFGQQFRNYRGIRIFYTGENVRPNFAECDYAFTFDYCNHPNHMRMPLWYMRALWKPLSKKQNFDPRKLLAQKTKFCNFIYSNKLCTMRNRFFRKLSRYKRVDAAGRVFNNIGGRIGRLATEKFDFMRPYKFTIAFENEGYLGYTTEKLYDAMLAETLPIYFGNPRVNSDFNSASFLNYHDYGCLDALLERVIEVDQDDDLYCHYMQQPWFAPGQPDGQNTEPIVTRFDHIFSTAKVPVAQKAPSVRYLLTHPPHRAGAILKKKTVKIGRKLNYQIERFRIERFRATSESINLIKAPASS